MYLWSNGRLDRALLAGSGSGNGALPAVAAGAAAFWRNGRGIGKNCRRALSDPLSVLVNG